MNKDKIVITGGGTGGHLLPMMAVAKTLKSEYEVIIFTGYDKINGQVLELPGFKIIKILSGKIHRHHSLSSYLNNLYNLIKFSLGVIQAIIRLLLVRPQVIFSKGGYGSLPTVIAGHFLRIPVVLHESDLSPGLANRLALKYAQKICVSFPPENYNLPISKLVYTGHILRDLTHDPNIKSKLNLANLPTLLITGGSQGALVINKNIAKILPELLKTMNVIHLSGDKDFTWLQELKANLLETVGVYHLESFSPKIIDYMAVADLVLTRAGSNTLAEISALKKPAIIIPYRYAAANHQDVNARYFQKIGGGEVLNESEITPEILLVKISEFIKDPDRLKRSGQNAFAANQFNGCQLVKEEIDQIIKSKNHGQK